MKSWWDDLPDRCRRLGLGALAANPLREAFKEYCERFSAEIAILPRDQQAAAWEVFERAFLTAT